MVQICDAMSYDKAKFQQGNIRIWVLGNMVEKLKAELLRVPVILEAYGAIGHCRIREKFQNNS